MHYQAPYGAVGMHGNTAWKISEANWRAPRYTAGSPQRQYNKCFAKITNMNMRS